MWNQVDVHLDDAQGFLDQWNERAKLAARSLADFAVMSAAMAGIRARYGSAAELAINDADYYHHLNEIAGHALVIGSTIQFQLDDLPITRVDAAQMSTTINSQMIGLNALVAKPVERTAPQC